jgi:hypothetical protein
MRASRAARTLSVLAALTLIAACGSQTAQQPTSSAPSLPRTGSSGSPDASGSSGSSSAPAEESPTPSDLDPLTHRLLEEDFTTGPGVFHIGTTPDFRYAVKDGVYVITATSKEGGIAQSYGEFARTAYVIDTTATVLGAEELDLNTAVGIGCFDEAGKYGLALLMNADSSSGALIRLRNGRPDKSELTSWTTMDVEPVRTLRLLVAIAAPTGDDVALTAWVNGDEVMSTSTDGFNGCAGTMLFLIASERGTSIGYDDVVATVPDH